jgi:cytochrome bd-type quinol oxidase subunit 1
MSEDPEAFRRAERLLAALDRIGPRLRGAIYDLSLEAEQERPFSELLESLVELQRTIAPECDIESYRAVLLNPWLFAQFLHNQGGTVVTAAFVMAGLGAYYLLAHQHEAYGRMFVRVGLITAVIASL